jgi:hypothetical protein
MGIFNAIESQEELVLSSLATSQQVLYTQELALPNNRQYSLMGVSPGKSGQLVPGLERHADTDRSAKRDQPLQSIVATLPCHANMIQLPGT